MKKSLIALAALAALSTTAMAADVQVYGRIDMGLGYVHSDPVTGGDTTDSFTLDSGNGTSNRWGLKGSEELGNGMKVSFVLENGFKGDTGALKTADTLFDRESTLQLHGNFGTIAFGRSAILGTDGGSFNLLGGVDPFGTGMGSIGNQGLIFAGYDDSRRQNNITYRSPKFGGFQVTAQYAMGDNDVENESGSDRAWGLGLTFKDGPVDAVLLVEGNNEKSASKADNVVTVTDEEDMIRVTLGGNYDFGVMKLYAAGHYFHGADLLGAEGFKTFVSDVKPLGHLTDKAETAIGFDEMEGYSAMLGADVPAMGGTLSFAAGYQHVKSDEQDFKADTYFLAAGYNYWFSKKVRWYSGIGYNAATYKWDNVDTNKREESKPDSIYVTSGLSYYF